MTRDPVSSPLSVGLVAESVLHELRQPLSLIVGYAELLARSETPEAERGALLGEIRLAAARMAGSLAHLERGDGSRRLRFGPHGEREVLDLRA